MQSSEASRNLVIVHTVRAQALSDWQTVEEKIRERAPDIEVRIVDNNNPDPAIAKWQATRPSLVFSTIRLFMYAPSGGKVYAGREEGKLDQVRRLTAAGMPAPPAYKLLPFMPLKPEVWGDYVIVKPVVGSFGDHVRLVRTEEAGRRYAQLTENGKREMVVQKYVDHTDAERKLKQYRVLTLFGRPLYAIWRRSAEPLPPLEKIAADPLGRIASNYRGVEREYGLAHEDEDVLALASGVAAACPEFPCLGVDIVREHGTGKLWVFETNSSGYVWHFSSQFSDDLSDEHRKILYEQFNALDRTADILIEKTRAEARW
jgi:hypothetical protein